jgi:hypothetical protein
VVSTQELLDHGEGGPNPTGTPAALPADHVLHAAVEHPSWCEWMGLVPLIECLTGPGFYRCPGCWGEPSATA